MYLPATTATEYLPTLPIISIIIISTYYDTFVVSFVTSLVFIYSTVWNFMISEFNSPATLSQRRNTKVLFYGERIFVWFSSVAPSNNNNNT